MTSNTMKILSNYKDYYDYLAHLYGVDDGVVFNRNKVLALPAEVEHLGLPVCQALNDQPVVPENQLYEHYFGSTNWYYYESRTKICQFECVSIVGTLYYYLYEYDRVKKTAQMRIPKKEDYVEYVRWRKKGHRQVLGYPLWMDVYAGAWTHPRDGWQMGIVPPGENAYIYGFDRSLHKKLGAPILWKYIEGKDGTRSLVLPLLSNISGFSGLYPAEKIYRDIYNFLLALRTSPDTGPPVEVDNNAKIAKHGFDARKSFRHPVKIGGKRKNAKQRGN